MLTKKHARRALVALVVASALTTASTLTHATPYWLHQGGFTGGGEVSLTFDGVDKNKDGWIDSRWEGEVTQASLTFLGNAEIPDFASGIIDQTNSFMELLVSFKEGGGIVGDEPNEGVYFAASPDSVQPLGKRLVAYFSGGVVGDSSGLVMGVLGSGDARSVASSSVMVTTVSQVPEPATMWSMAVGLVALGAVIRRRQASTSA